MHSFYRCKKVALRFWAIAAIFTKQPKVNNDPGGENSPNLVTLVES
jgi:hypothetical protein